MKDLKSSDPSQKLQRFWRGVVDSTIRIFIENIKNRNKHTFAQLSVWFLSEIYRFVCWIFMRLLFNQSSIIYLKIRINDRRNYIIFNCTNNPTLKTVGMDNVCHSMHHHSATTLFCSFFIPVLGIHLFHRKIAVLILKTIMIHREQLTKDLTFNLFDKVIDGITIDKCSFFCIMCMQVKIERKSIVTNEVIRQLFYCIYRWLLLKVRVYVVSIQIFAKSVHSEMAVKHTVDIDHGNNHENKHFFQ